MDNLVKIEHKGNKYELDLREKVTVIRGDSSTGKTILFKALIANSHHGNNKNIGIVYEDMTINSFIELLNNKDKELIVIDNADFILDRNFVEEINKDPSKKFLLMGRIIPGLETGYGSTVELNFHPEDRLFTLKRM